MKIVVDTNILFSFFWKNSLTKRLLESQRSELISPEIALNEIIKYKKEIINKSKIDSKQFETYLKKIKDNIEFIKMSEYKDYLEEASNLSPDKKDSDFFALCLKENTFLWTNDSLLKRQDKIRVLNTEEIINLIFS